MLKVLFLLYPKFLLCGPGKVIEGVSPPQRVSDQILKIKSLWTVSVFLILVDLGHWQGSGGFRVLEASASLLPVCFLPFPTVFLAWKSSGGPAAALQVLWDHPSVLKMLQFPEICVKTSVNLCVCVRASACFY